MIRSINALLGRTQEDPYENGTEEAGEDRGRSGEAARPSTPTQDGRRIARDLITEQLDQAEATFTETWEQQGDLVGSIAALKQQYGWRTALACLEDQASSEELQFHVDGLALADCYAELFAEPETESIVYLTGMVLDGNMRTVNRCLPFAQAEQSAVQAVGDPDASFDVLQELDRAGHYLVAHAHNQPGTGVESTTPSRVDRDFQGRLEAAGYETIGLIFTQDGWVRAFSNELSFDIAVQGNQITNHDKNTFRIQNST